MSLYESHNNYTLNLNFFNFLDVYFSRFIMIQLYLLNQSRPFQYIQNNNNKKINPKSLN